MTKNKNYNPKMSFGQKLEDWPPESLEPVISCPVCNCKSRKMLHNNLADKVFHVAPGHWTLYRCQDCRSAYLDPRPSAESIHLANLCHYMKTKGKRNISF